MYSPVCVSASANASRPQGPRAAAAAAATAAVQFQWPLDRLLAGQQHRQQGPPGLQGDQRAAEESGTEAEGEGARG